jgi:hypothetical protein
MFEFLTPAAAQAWVSTLVRIFCVVIVSLKYNNIFVFIIAG